MIPEILKLKGFLSYKNEQTLDFTKFHVALISGENGQGKSSLLDAMTFALFGVARGVGGGGRGTEDLVSNGRDFLKVEFVFLQHGRRYRIVRTYDKLKRISSVRLDVEKDKGFANVSEGKKRETELAIKKIIGMDYEAFVTSSFIMQGKADFFTVKSETEKIEILRQILGLEVYEKAREVAITKIRLAKKEKEEIEKRIKEIETEVSKKPDAEKYLEEIKKKEKEITEKEKALEKEEKLLEERFSQYKLSKQKSESLKNEVADLREKKGKERLRLNSLREKLHLFKETVEKKEEILSGYDKFNKNEEQINRLYEKKNATEKLLREKEKRESEIDKALKIFAERKENLEKLVSASEETVKEKKKTASLLETEFRKAKLELEQVKEALKEKEETVSELKNLLEEKNKKLAEKNKILSEIEKIYALKTERTETLNKALQKHKEEVSKLKEEKQVIINTIKSSSEQVTEEANILKEKQSVLHTEIENLANEKTELLKEKSVLENALAEISEKEKLLEGDVKNCPLCGAPLTPEHAMEIKLQYKNSAEKTREKLSEISKKLSGILREIKNKKTEEESLIKEISKKEKEKESAIKLEERIKGLDARIENLVSETKKTEEKLKTKILTEEETSNLRFLKTKLEKYSEITEESVLALKDKLLSAENEKENTQSRVSEIKTLLEKIKANIKNANEIIAFEEEKQRKAKKELADIEEKIASPLFMEQEKKAIKDIEKRIKEIGFDETELDAKLSSRKNLETYKKLYEKLREAETHISEIEERIKESETSLKEIDVEMSEKSSEISKLERTLKELEKSGALLEEKRSELKELREIAKNITAERVRAESEIKMLVKMETELSELKNKLSVFEEDLKILEVCKEMFGKSGIQIEIIRDATPVVENIANEMLSDMTNGRMSLKFDTIKNLRTKDAVRDTFEISVYDNGEKRRYALFSGGEQFRINLAIRIAISRFLSERAGAPLEMLVIDEGFGSQDEYGKSKIIEEINSFKDKFKKIIVITHVSDIKENFNSYEIRVVKDESGSRLIIA